MDKLETLRHYFGYDRFRPGQEELIDSILAGRDTIGIMPTGAGKSLCYQVPALMLPGVTLVISPLIALMKDQVMALKAAGVPAAYLNTTLNPGQMQLAMERAVQGSYKIIYVAPERLKTAAFRRMAQRMNISLVAVDEAHCVSHWGHEFRKDYGEIAGLIRSLPQRPHYAAFTATATEEVKQDMITLLGMHDPLLLVTGFNRPNLYYEVLEPVYRDRALVYICRAMKNQSGIVYCLSRKNVETVCELLQDKGFSATRYHAKLDTSEKQQNQEDFQYDRKRIMVATSAFGMGIDKSNVRFVIHYNMPLSLEEYYQQAGRAGRDGLPAQCILLFQEEDVFLGNYLLQHNDEPGDEVTKDMLLARKLEKQRFQAMQTYGRSRGCLRGILLRYFGEDAPETCPGCVNCTGTHYPRLDERLRYHASFYQLKPRPDQPSRPASGRQPVFVPSPLRPASAPSQAAPPQPQLGPDPSTLIGQLELTRQELAEKNKLPAYIICSDATLIDMAEKVPVTLEAMATVSGMGYAKAQAYGRFFLAVILAWVNEHPEDYGCDVEDWSEEEERDLRILMLAGKDPRAIAIRLNRSLLSVLIKLEDMKTQGETVNEQPLRPAALRPAPKPTHHPRSWSFKETNWLKSLHAKRRTVHDIAIQLSRPDMEIVQKLRELGLQPFYGDEDEQEMT